MHILTKEATLEGSHARAAPAQFNQSITLQPQISQDRLNKGQEKRPER